MKKKRVLQTAMVGYMLSENLRVKEELENVDTQYILYRTLSKN